jgi:uncharacterized coiled-coil protein SlyX
MHYINTAFLFSEKKIDRIEDRLAGIEQVLENLAAKLGNLDIQNSHTEQSSQTKSSRVGKSPKSLSEAVIITSNSTPFEGETAFNSQSGLARDFLEQAVGNTPSIVLNADIQAALTSLQDMVAQQAQRKSTTNIQTMPHFTHALTDIDPAKLERPPWDAVEDVLEMASSTLLS